jgi:S-adenosylmethionine uptake transporter
MNANYLRGVSWFILSLIISNLNDVIAKLLTFRLDPLQVSSMRFFWSLVSLTPLVLYYGTKCLKTNNIKLHLMRGSIFYLAIYMWINGVSTAPLSTVTTLSFTVPIFVLMLAPKFLKEEVSRVLWFSTLACLLGTIFILEPFNDTFEPLTLLLIISSLLFAILDVVNKKYIVQEGIIPMMFYSALVSLFCSLPGSISAWQQPSFNELFNLALLGVGSNAILFCLLTAFKYVNASALSPYRYMELIISVTVGYIYFSEIPTLVAALGSTIIVLTTMFVARQQMIYRKTS